MDRTVFRMELKNKRKKELERTKRRLAILILIMVFIIFGVYTSFSAKARNVTDNMMNTNSISIEETYTPVIGYTSYQITAGSSLWGISDNLSLELGLSVPDTIDLLKGINGLISDEIYEGQIIIIPYVKDQNLYI